MKNYVKKLKGYDVPEGVSRFKKFSDDETEFYDADGNYFDADHNRWCKSPDLDNYQASTELPTIPEINWDEQPEGAVWIESEKLSLSGWHKEVNGFFYNVIDSTIGWSKEAEADGRITVYRREDCVGEPKRHVHADLMIEYANDPSIEIERNIVSRWRADSNPSFHPSWKYRKKSKKSQREIEREAFVGECAADIDVDGVSLEAAKAAAAQLFDLGYKAPEEKGDE